MVASLVLHDACKLVAAVTVTAQAVMYAANAVPKACLLHRRLEYPLQQSCQQPGHTMALFKRGLVNAGRCRAACTQEACFNT